MCAPARLEQELTEEECEAEPEDVGDEQHAVQQPVPPSARLPFDRAADAGSESVSGNGSATPPTPYTRIHDVRHPPPTPPSGG